LDGLLRGGGLVGADAITVGKEKMIATK
jgi:hypothetical protein